jgi:hypothetical protein
MELRLVSSCESVHTLLRNGGDNLRAMIRYRVSSRVVAVAEDLYHVAVTATREDQPRDGVISRRQECRSRHGAEQMREILVNQVTAAVQAVGGHVVALESQ